MGELWRGGKGIKGGGVKEAKGNRRAGKCSVRGVKLWEGGEWKEGKEEGGGGRRW